MALNVENIHTKKGAIFRCSYCFLSYNMWNYNVQMSSMMQPSSAQNWLGSQGSSSGLIVKRTIRVDIPVEQYPNVLILLQLLS